MDYSNVVAILTNHWHIVAILSLFCITWFPILKLKAFVSDDVEGIAKFSDYFRPEGKEPNGAIIPELLVDYYQFEVPVYKGLQKMEEKKDKDGKNVITIRCKNTQLNPYIGFPGCFLRWIRLQFGKKFVVLSKNKKGHEIYGYQQDPVRHHILSLIIHLANIILGYVLLCHLFGEEIAFFAILLFIVHPTACQTVAWISGINYLFSLLGALITFNLVLLHLPLQWILPLIFLSSGLSCFTLLPGCFNWIIILMIGGRWQEVAVAGAIALFVAWNQGKEVVNYRTEAFKAQQMGKSTKLNWRKPILMLKTLFYYTIFMPFPKRMGLFHTWGYHFDEKIERIDGRFWGGLLVSLGLLASFYYGPFIVKFSIVWMLIYVFTFLNLITAQQFVADRYVFIPAFGFSLILAFLLKSNPVIISLIIGLYLMRVWVHLPTFSDETRFYESNYWNFPNSEVALGNLGVVCMGRGHVGTAVDVWKKSAELNPFYDVAHYNLYSVFRSNGMMQMAREYMQKCLNSKTVHFPDQWKKEAEDIEKQAISSQNINDIGTQLYKHQKEANYERYNTI